MSDEDTLLWEPTAKELLVRMGPQALSNSDRLVAGLNLASRVEKVLAKCDSLSALDKRSGFKGDGGISIALVRRILNGEEGE